MSAGRPRKEISRKQVENMCAIQCTALEIAGVLNISPDLLDRRCKEWGFDHFADFFKRYSQSGKASLRRWQFKAAEEGNTGMMVWLGKQYLGQSEKTEITAVPRPTIIELPNRTIRLGVEGDNLIEGEVVKDGS